jgi:hypothetical protein
MVEQSTRYYNFGSSEDDTEKQKMKTHATSNIM